MKNECQSKTRVSRIKFSESGRKAILINTDREKFQKIRMDGCELINTKSADWAVLKCRSRVAVIELKGRDVRGAIQQISATMGYLKSKGYGSNKLAGLIVCSQYPRSDTGIQVELDKLTRLFKSRVTIETREREYIFEDLF